MKKIWAEHIDPAARVVLGAVPLVGTGIALVGAVKAGLDGDGVTVMREIAFGTAGLVGAGALRGLGRGAVRAGGGVDGVGQAPRRTAEAAQTGARQGSFGVAERVLEQLRDPRMGPLAGKISPDELQALAMNPRAMRYMDTKTGHVNVIQSVDNRLIRITIANRSRIISVGPIQPNGLRNGIINGRFIPLID